MAVWKCKQCKTWGLGGPNGFNAHWKSWHKPHNGRLGAQVQSFGFLPNYSNGQETTRRYKSQPVRSDNGLGIS